MSTTETAAKRDIQKLQRAIIDGLEDVKAQDIQVFNTEHLSPLFERVIVASGTSNRQTRALAASVRDAVRDAGFVKPRTEGEDNGEWIIVDCGAAVAHIMQPTFRQYYRLEDLWGEKPVRLRFGAPKPPEPPAAAAARKAAARKTAAAKKKEDGAAAPAPVRKASAAARTTATAGAEPAARKTPARRASGAAAKKAAAKKLPAASAAANKAPAKKNAPPAKKAPAKKAAARSATTRASRAASAARGDDGAR